MTFLPIVDRELRVIARRRSTYWARFFAGLAVLVIWIVLSFSTRSTARPAELSQNLFVAMSVIGLGFALLAGIFLTADCLSMEKREGTLGLLFLTDLKGYDVVLGKLAATSVNAIYALLTIFPVMALSLLMGGVTVAEFGRQAAVLATTLYLSLALGLFVSALSREAQHAMLAVFLAMLALTGLVPLFTAVLEELHRRPLGHNPLNWLSPVFSFYWAFDSSYSGRSGAEHFLGSLLTQFSLGTVLLALACVLLPRRWQAREEAPRPAAPPLARASIVAAAQRSHRAAVQRRCQAGNPFFWLAGRESRSGRVNRWTVIGLFLVWLGLFALAFHSRTRSFGFVMSVFGAYVLHFAYKCLAAMEATRRFSTDRASGALEILLATPLTERAIVDGQWAALRNAFLLPAVLSSLANIALLYLVNSDFPSHVPGRERVIFNEILVGGILLFFLDVWALSWVGMEQALRRRRHHWAVLATLGRVALGPWTGILLFIFLAMGNGIRSEKHVYALITLWLLSGVVLDCLVGIKARWRVRHSFRRIAAGER